MANIATANISSNILPDDIKARFSGTLSHTPSSAISTVAGTEGWVYIETPATSSSTNIMTTSHQYLGTTIALANDDLVRWICIEHTGTTNGTIKTNEGIVIGLNTAAAYNTEGMIFLEPNELVALKVPLTEVHEIFFRSCIVGSGEPSANGNANVQLKIAAIIRNVA